MWRGIHGFPLHEAKGEQEIQAALCFASAGPLKWGTCFAKAMFEWMAPSLRLAGPSAVGSPPLPRTGRGPWCFSPLCTSPLTLDHQKASLLATQAGLLGLCLSGSQLLSFKACLFWKKKQCNSLQMLFAFHFIMACHAVFFESLLIYYLFHFFSISLLLHAVPPVSSLPPNLCSRV